MTPFIVKLQILTTQMCVLKALVIEGPLGLFYDSVRWKLNYTHFVTLGNVFFPKYMHPLVMCAVYLNDYCPF